MPQEANSKASRKSPPRRFNPQHNHGHPEESVQGLDPIEFAQYLAEAARRRPLIQVAFALDQLAPIEGSTVLNPSRIMFGIEGRFPVVYGTQNETRTINLSPGEMIFVGSKSWTCPLWKPDACKVGNIVFEQTFTRFTIREWSGKDSAPSSNRYLHSPAPFGNVVKHVVSALELQSLSHAEPDRSSQHLVSALFLELKKRLEQLAAEPPSGRGKGLAVSTWRAIASYVEEHYHETINLEDVARLFSMNADHISRLFKTVGGENFNKFITRLRMGKSEYLLRNYQLSIEDIAIQCGFTDAGYFRKVFCKHFGTTPNRFRRTLAAQQRM